jgi:8-oxo-dGTP diphosphatase
MKNIINKLHLGVYVVVQNEAGMILLIKKSRGPYTGKFDLPGGKMEHGESPQETASRELQEEVGIECHDFVLLDNMTALVPFKDGDEDVSMHHVGMVYSACITNADKKASLSIEDQDVSGASWIDLETIASEALSPFAQKVATILKSIH